MCRAQVEIKVTTLCLHLCKRQTNKKQQPKELGVCVNKASVQRNEVLYVNMFAPNNTLLADSPQWQVKAGQEATTLSTWSLSNRAFLIQLSALNVRHRAWKQS